MGEPLAALTKREREVFWLVVERLRNREIAEQLFVAERTIESHVASLLRKLGGTNRSDLIALGAQVREQVPDASRIPRILSSFVGREQETDELRRIAERQRLVTLTGPAGVGKTRLAFHVARLAPGLPSPALVDLATVPTTEPVERAFASALGLVDAGSLRTAIREALRYGQHWLIIDNAEHVAEACGDLLRDLMTAANGLHVLATSRWPLAVAGEVVVEIAPLNAPTVSDDPAEVLAAGSARLFADRAAGAAPGFQVTSSNAREVATLCRRLDGLPLAIELAAARIRTFSVAELVRHLDDRFALLTGGFGEEPHRHTTLMDALQWSHELLDEDERLLFERLSVFPGEFDYDTARAVAAYDPLDPNLFLRLFPRILDRSLLSSRRKGGSSTSYRMLETFRAFCRERLEERGEKHEVERRHADHHVEYAVSLVPDLLGRDQPTALRWFASHEFDIVAAMRHLLRDNDDATAWRLVAGIGKGWSIVGIRGELFEWLESLLDRPLPEGDLGLKARVAAAYLLMFRDTQRSVELAEEADQLVQAGHPSGRAFVELALGWALAYLGDDERAVDLLRRAADDFRGAGDPWHEGLAFQGIGRASRHADAIVDNLQRAVDRFRSAGDGVSQANSLTMLASRCLEFNIHLDEIDGWLDDARDLAQLSENFHELLHVDLHRARLRQIDGEHEEAAEAFERLLPALRRIGDHRCTRRCLIGLGWAAIMKGDHAKAHELLTAGVATADEVLDPRETAAGLRLLTVLAQHAGDSAEARRLQQAADEAASQLDPKRREALPTVAGTLHRLAELEPSAAEDPAVS